MTSSHDSSISGGSAMVNCCLAKKYVLDCSHSLLLPLGMGNWSSLPLMLAYMLFHRLSTPLEFSDSALSLEPQTWLLMKTLYPCPKYLLVFFQHFSPKELDNCSLLIPQITYWLPSRSLLLLILHKSRLPMLLLNN